jgi:HKD family nuclease
MAIFEGNDTADKLNELMDTCNSFSVAVAWITDNHVYRKLKDNRNKIDNLVIGCDFFNTSPTVLSDIFKEDALNSVTRILEPSNNTFHPKLYFFEFDDKWKAVIGSTNMTRSAFQNNIEMTCSIGGEKGSDSYLKIKAFIDREYNRGIELKREFIDDYAYKYHRFKRLNRAAQQPEPDRIRAPAINLKNIMTIDFRTYFEMVSNDSLNSLQMRLNLLSVASQLMQEGFENLNEIKRKCIAGTVTLNQLKKYNDEELIEIEWGLFGNVTAAGNFMHAVIHNYNAIGEALEHIPNHGNIVENNYNDFKESFIQIFNGTNRPNQFAGATRLLSMKRPDYFLSLNKANTRKLRTHLGIVGITFQSYWDKFVVPIMHAPWWKDSHGQLTDENMLSCYNGRVAMLDAILYEA